MSNRGLLDSFIARLQHRLRLGAWLRGAAVFCGAALLVTVALVLLLNLFAFPARGVSLARFAIFAALAAAAAFGLALPLARLTRARAVRRAESANPDLDQRLTTFEERARNNPNPIEAPFLELLAADTLARTRDFDPRILVPGNRLFALSGAGLACLAVLVWIVAAGPGYLGYGASLLWTGPGKNAAPFYTIVVTPGDATVRRNSDQLITAIVTGMAPSHAHLFAHFQSAAGWESVAMQPAPDSGSGATYGFVFAGLPENVEYYVAAGPLASPRYTVRVVDLPSVKQIRVTYRYPAWTGMKSVTAEHSGDLRAIEGTDATVEVQMDRPLPDGQLLLDDGQSIPLTAATGNSDPGNAYRGVIHMEKDGAYHLASTSEGQPVRLSEDYFIATDKALPPEIAMDRPGGDYRASPIEEVTLGVKAADPFGLAGMHLHYSVNGGPDRDISLLKTPAVAGAEAAYTLPLEDFKLVPGDLVSVYATAKDGHAEARTDISFIQVDPFEREFSQSQQSGGGGGGASGNQTEISKREKELIAATWKQQNDNTATPKDAAAQGQFLSDAQQKLRDQVLALSLRIQSRDISSANEEFTDFDSDMQAAAAAMSPSAEKLKTAAWKDAIPLEQKALQALLRAEATFRRIEVAFGQSGGGGGGNAGRDLASLFDLELDTEKNQYETAQSASPAEQHEKDVEDALQKLDALARRQEDLAGRQHDPQQSFEERWQQEMLRREAEQLQRQMEQMAQNGQQGSSASPAAQSDARQNSPQNPRQGSSMQSGSQSPNGSQSSSRPNVSGSSASQSSDPRIEQALSRLEQATGAMSRGGTPEQSADAARQAAERLREATGLLAGSQQQLASGKLDSLAGEAGRLTAEERAQADRIGKLASRQNVPTNADGSTDLESLMARLHERDQLAAERQQLSSDLSSLQKNLRGAARALAPNQPAVARKLRDALTGMDDSDLDNRVQRTADWLRSGVNPNSNGTESEIAQGLGNLSRQLQQAQQEMGRDIPSQGSDVPGDRTAALERLERLRNQIEAISPSQNAQAARNRPNQPGQSGPRANALSNNGDLAGLGGETRYGGRAADGTAWGNFDTGNNTPRLRGTQQAAPGDASANPTDTERTYRQSLRELNQLRQMVLGDPQTAQEVADLTRQMQYLDPTRFPGNPAMVERMHREVLSSVDRLELEFERDGMLTDTRIGKPYAVPAGYQDSVAEYYRRLGKNP